MTNHSNTTIEGWDVEFVFAKPLRVSKLWNADSPNMSTSGFTAVPTAENSSIDPDSNLKFGFIARKSRNVEAEISASSDLCEFE